MLKRYFIACVLLTFIGVGNRSLGQTDHDPLKPHPNVAPALKLVDQKIAAGPFEASWPSLEKYEIPQWYKDAKFGIFIHWGVYSVPAYGSEWYPRQMYIDTKRRGDNFFQHHVSQYGSQKTFGYKDFIPQFKAEKFDAKAWVALFQQAGARYIIPVAEHHDGFPMYDCSFTKWDASEMGPKRDIIAELVDATRSAGLKFGVSSHRAFNWMFYVRSQEFDNADPKYAGLYGRPMPFLFEEDAWKYQEPGKFVPQDEQFKDDWLARNCEIIDKYKPDVFWFDFGITPGLRKQTFHENPFAPHLQKFAAYYYNVSAKQGDVGVINYKWGAFPEKAAVLDKERSKMAEIRRPFWQTDTAVSNSSWGYTKDQRYKKPGRLINDLVDIVSKNGCLLLNVGPAPDGTIPAEDTAILQEIGAWLKTNGEAIYGTTCWKVFGEGPTGVSTGHVSERNDKPFTAEDIRFTSKADDLYVIGLAWPEDGQAKIKSLADGGPLFTKDIAEISMLGVEGGLKWTRDDKGLNVKLPSEKPTQHAYVLKIKTK